MPKKIKQSKPYVLNKENLFSLIAFLSLLNKENQSFESNNSPTVSQSLPRFLTMSDVQRITHWGKNRVRELFNEKDFPACDYGKEKLVEYTAFIKFFSVRREKKDTSWYKEGGEY